MPWRESSPMSERLAFVQACLNRHEHIAEICTRFGISEKTGHKWLARFRAGGLEGLLDRGHAPHHHRFHVGADVAARIMTVRRQHPLYGAAKVRDWLVQHEPETRWPAASTIGELLKREGLLRARHRPRRRVDGGRSALVRTTAHAPNVVWTADFKGEVRVPPSGPGAYCYPLTVLDLHTHYLLGCQALPTTAVAPTRRIFARLFAAYGLPDVVRTDNGVPFAQPNALGRLGALAYWFIRLGIHPEFIRPARPAENGAHERFHKTLKAHTLRPPAVSLLAQQQRFDRFRVEYNTERPHESTVAHRPPADQYVPSPRPYPARLPPLVYPEEAAVRRVDASGVVKWKQQPIFLSTNLTGEYVGVFATEGDQLRICYARFTLGTFDPHTKRLTTECTWNSPSDPEPVVFATSPG